MINQYMGVAPSTFQVVHANVGGCQNPGPQWVIKFSFSFYEGNPFLSFSLSTAFSSVWAGPNVYMYLVLVKLSRLHASPQRVAENWKSPYFMEIFQMSGWYLCHVCIAKTWRLANSSRFKLPPPAPVPFTPRSFSCSVAVIMSDDPTCWNHPGADNPTGSNTPKKSLPYPKPSLYKPQSFFQHTRFPNKHTLDFRLPEFLKAWITTAQQEKKAQQKPPFAIQQSNVPHLFCGSTQPKTSPQPFWLTPPKKSAEKNRVRFVGPCLGEFSTSGSPSRAATAQSGLGLFRVMVRQASKESNASVSSTSSVSQGLQSLIARSKSTISHACCDLVDFFLGAKGLFFFWGKKDRGKGWGEF